MNKKTILVLNCGSSSIKFAIIDVDKKKYISGIAENFYLPELNISWHTEGKQKQKINIPIKDNAHNTAINFIINNIIIKENKLAEKLIAIGHRIVHGGEKFKKSVIIDNETIKIIEKYIPFAPLHHPAHLIGIREVLKNLPNLKNKNVAVFDTSFHQTMPEESYLYALPYYLYKKHGIRRYGAHGISHFYISEKTSEILNKPKNKLNIISCHLGNGGSVCAINNGVCVDTSMGLTPLEGLVMGTRSGDIDPAIIFYLNNKLNMTIDKINKLLTTESGLLGITETTSDCRYIEKNYLKKENAKRAIKIYCHRLSKYIGAYSVLMENKLDALIFTGGIGENSMIIRELTVNKLSILGFKIDNELNKLIRFGKQGVINTSNSRLIMVIPTNEELIIAKETLKLI